MRYLFKIRYRNSEPVKSLEDYINLQTLHGWEVLSITLIDEGRMSVIVFRLLSQIGTYRETMILRDLKNGGEGNESE